MAEDKERKSTKPISLNPLSAEEVIKALLETPPLKVESPNEGTDSSTTKPQPKRLISDTSTAFPLLLLSPL